MKQCKEVEILEVGVKMLNLKKAITRINIDLLRNERKILFLENLIEHLIQNEHNVSIIMDKSVHLDKYIDEKMDKFDKVKETNFKSLNSKKQTKLKCKKKMSQVFANNMIKEDMFLHKKMNVNTEEISVKNKCVLDYNDDYSQLILTLENEIQQIVEEFENECEKLNQPFIINTVM